MKKGCIIALVAVFAILSFALGYYFYSQSKKDPVEYEYVSLVKDNVIQKTVATGSIKPRREVQIKPQVSGIVDQIFVEAGEIVAKGQRLAKIKLIPSPVNINNAESSVELARIRYKQAQREFERQREVFDKNLDIAAAQVNYNNAQKESERSAGLFAEGVISDQENNATQLDLSVSEAELGNARIVAGNNLKQFQSDVEVARQELDAAVTNLQLLREGASRKYGQISNEIVSTVDGMVLDVPVEEGSSVIERNNFNEGTSIAVVADMKSLIFEGKIDESEVGKLRENMPLELTIGAIEDHKFEAILEHIAPQGVLEEGTVKFEVKADIKPSEEVFLRAGYSASADIILDRRDSVLTIFERDIIFSGDTTFVELQLNDEEIERHQIEIGLTDGIRAEVLSGLGDEQKIRKQTGAN